MKFKNAGLESIDEFIAGMDNGIRYYYDDCIFYYDKSQIIKGKSPYVAELNGLTNSIRNYFNSFEKMQIEKNLEKELPNEKGIICFVSDSIKNPIFGSSIRFINDRSKHSGRVGNKLYFIDSNKCTWNYANPVNKDDLWGD